MEHPDETRVHAVMQGPAFNLLLIAGSGGTNCICVVCKDSKQNAEGVGNLVLCKSCTFSSNDEVNNAITEFDTTSMPIEKKCQLCCLWHPRPNCSQACSEFDREVRKFLSTFPLFNAPPSEAERPSALAFEATQLVLKFSVAPEHIRHLEPALSRFFGEADQDELVGVGQGGIDNQHRVEQQVLSEGDTNSEERREELHFRTQLTKQDKKDLKRIELESDNPQPQNPDKNTLVYTDHKEKQCLLHSGSTRSLRLSEDWFPTEGEKELTFNELSNLYRFSQTDFNMMTYVNGSLAC